jgi:hypothetical protein
LHNFQLKTSTRSWPHTRKEVACKA